MQSDSQIPTGNEPASEAPVRLERVVRTPGFREPKISVDRMSKRIGCFDGFDIVRDFQSYTSEPDALKDAHEWFTTRTIHVPQVVFPMVRKMRVS